MKEQLPGLLSEGEVLSGTGILIAPVPYSGCLNTLIPFAVPAWCQNTMTHHDPQDDLSNSEFSPSADDSSS